MLWPLCVFLSLSLPLHLWWRLPLHMLFLLWLSLSLLLFRVTGNLVGRRREGGEGGEAGERGLRRGR